ncbi:dephospho-CoA kinase [Burkholderiales bacterium]|nr:dephospho-CoA kinase [Burkholderiales bacterium]
MTLVVGMTGGIGSGKSAVAAAFRALGVEVVDADEVAHEISAPGREGHRNAVAALGDRILAADGTLDRARLRERAFADASFRGRLEAALHPPIRDEIRRRVAAWRGDYGVLVVPLLFERGATASIADRVLVVDCPEDEQVRRVQERSGLSEREVRAIMATQLPRADRLARADDVFDNSGPREAIVPAVTRLDAAYRALARAKSDARP